MSLVFCSFLTQCRPRSVSMGNAIKFLKLEITHSSPDMPEEQIKPRTNKDYNLLYNFRANNNLIKSIDKFIQEKNVLAGVAISEIYARTKINEGDVILTYAW
ncbi:unnamed protein product [Porites evermanni]|uniref:Translation initiation factor eIF2B subunit delta n=1 Tax=Porites evermanni TaxID=104178 RepID=A0ABN8M0C7_9CNID|nr:unnamed protein product [Porites evermanni]